MKDQGRLDAFTAGMAFIVFIAALVGVAMSAMGVIG